MARNPQFSGYNRQSKFLLGKASKLSPEPTGIKYYEKTKHTRDQGSLQEAFLASFNSQVYPTILPGRLLPPFVAETFRILSELSQPMLTEVGDYLILE